MERVYHSITRNKFLEIVKNKLVLVKSDFGINKTPARDIFVNGTRAVIVLYSGDYVSYIHGGEIMVTANGDYALRIQDNKIGINKYYVSTRKIDNIEWEERGIIAADSEEQAEYLFSRGAMPSLICKLDEEGKATKKWLIYRKRKLDLNRIKSLTQLKPRQGSKKTVEEGIVEYFSAIGLTPPKRFCWVKSPREAAEIIENIPLRELRKKDIYAETSMTKLINFVAILIQFCPVESFVIRHLWHILGGDAAKISNSVELPSLYIATIVYRWLVNHGWMPHDLYYSVLSAATQKISSGADLLQFSPTCETVILLERAKSIELSRNDILHNERGPISVFANGEKVYAMDNVILPAYIVEEPAEKIPIEKVLMEQNASVRAIGLRKIGPRRLLESGELKYKIIDEDTDSVGGKYRLLDIYLPGETPERKLYRPFLEMTNPSTGEKHLEGVSPSCRTVKSALNWRNYGFSPSVLT